MKVKVSLVIACLIGVFMWLSWQNSFESLDNMIQDTIMQTGQAVDPRIIIIGIDDESLDKIGRWQDWKRTFYAEIINKLSEGKPAAIGVDIEFPDRSGNPEDDEALVSAVKASGKVVLPAKGIFGEQGIVPVGFDEPFEELKKVAAAIGHINTYPDPDKVVRRSLHYLPFNNGKVYSFAYQIFRTYLKSTGDSSVPEKIPLDKYNQFLVNFSGPPGTYEYFPFYQVMDGEIPVEYFEGKIVLIGPYATGMLDQYMTPMSYAQRMNGVEIHANIIQNLLDQVFKREAPPVLNMGAVLLLGVLSFLMFLRFKPVSSTVAMVTIIGVFAGLSIAAYKILDLVIYTLYPIVIIVLIYLVVLAYKYLAELLERNRITGIFGKYVAPEVVKHIIAGGDESLQLGGTKTEISVMFVDIRGFTPLSEKVEPDELVKILNEYFDVTVSSIFKFGGTLDKFIGDATMAIFNAPLPLEDHAYKAICAAFEMQHKSGELRERILQKYNISLHFGIGINTGMAVVGNIGTSFRMEYTAIGDTVNTAARLESNAKQGEILISAATYEIVKDRIQASFNGEMSLKGKIHPVPVYKVDGVKAS